MPEQKRFVSAKKRYKVVSCKIANVNLPLLPPQ